MKLLEKRPETYDKTISLLSLGKDIAAKQFIKDHYIQEQDSILDLGTGTGNFAFLCRDKAARITGVDISADMLRIARQKKAKMNQTQNIQFIEAGIGELDSALAGQTFDKIVISLLFSELDSPQQSYTLKQVHSLLKPHGKLIIADEVVPGSTGKRILYHTIRGLTAVVSLIFKGGLTHPLQDIATMVQQAGFEVVYCKTTNFSQSFCILVAQPATQDKGN